MNNRLNFLKKHDILATLANDCTLNKKEVASLVQEILRELKSINTFDNHHDIIGSIYEKKIHQVERKVLGEFYTPEIIVNYILDSVDYIPENNIEELKLIDISCGSGSFLIEAVRRLLNRWKRKLKTNEFSDISIKEAKLIIENIQECVIGMDVNPVAVILCQINFYFILYDIIHLLETKIREYVIPRFSISYRSALTLQLNEEFDFVVGNPPYLFIRDIPKDQRERLEKSSLETNVGQYDYYQVFLEIGIRILKNKGHLGYIIPDSFLSLSNRRIIRKYLYHNTKIKELDHVGQKFDDPIVSNTIVIVQKEKDKVQREKNIITVNHVENNKKSLKTYVQNDVKNWNYDFLINLDDVDLKLLLHLKNNFLKLKDIMNLQKYNIILARGVELGKGGKVVYCDNCKKYLPLPKKKLICSRCNNLLDKNSIEKIIYKSVKESIIDFLPFIYSIDQYNVKEYRYIDTSKKGIKYKEMDLYKNKIVIRQMSKNNRICATYTKSISLTSQSFYILKIINSPTLEFNIYYLLGLINSKLLAYFFMKSFGSYKKLFPRILIEKIKEFPIKIPDNEKEAEIALKISEKVQNLLISNEMDTSHKVEIQKEIDSMIFDLYQIPEHVTKKICNHFSHQNFKL